MEIGFLGLGNMGRPMALNLVRAGHRVRVWNRSPGPARALAGEGAEAVATPAEAFRGDVVVTMLADDAALRAVVLESGALGGGEPPGVHAGMSTISVALARELADAHAAAGVPYVAAPVFGRPDVAAAAGLNVIAAGDPAAIERARPALEAMGRAIWPVGDDPVRANAVKLAGNFTLVAAIEAMSEAAALARGYGVEAGALIEILTGTLFAGSPVHKGYGAAIAAERFEPPGFGLALGAKDVRLALAAGEAARVPLPLASVLRDALLEAIAAGDGERDLAALSRVSRRRAGGI